MKKLTIRQMNYIVIALLIAWLIIQIIPKLPTINIQKDCQVTVCQPAIVGCNCDCKCLNGSLVIEKQTPLINWSYQTPIIGWPNIRNINYSPHIWFTNFSYINLTYNQIWLLSAEEIKDEYIRTGKIYREIYRNNCTDKKLVRVWNFPACADWCNEATEKGYNMCITNCKLEGYTCLGG